MRRSLVSAFAALFMGGTMITAPALADITIGFIGPVTGPVAAYGIQASNGAQTAIEAINAKGGINGENLVLKIYDDAADPKQAVSAANQVAGDGVLFVVGPVTSNAAMPASNVLEENGIVMVTPSATGSELSSRGLWNVFRVIGRDDQQASYAAEYAAKHWADKRIAIVHDNETYGKGLADSFKEGLNAAGVHEVYYGSITRGEKDYNVMVNRLKDEKVDYVYFGGYHPEGGILLRQMREQGVKAILIGGEGMNTTELGAIAGNAIDGTIFTSSVDVSKEPAAREAMAQFKAKNIPVEVFTLNGYAAVQVLADGLKRVGNADDPEGVAEVLKSGEPIPTILGDITYGERGDMTSKAFSLFEWKDGTTIAPLAD